MPLRIRDPGRRVTAHETTCDAPRERLPQRAEAVVPRASRKGQLPVLDVGATERIRLPIAELLAGVLELRLELPLRRRVNLRAVLREEHVEELVDARGSVRDSESGPVQDGRGLGDLRVEPLARRQSIGAGLLALCLRPVDEAAFRAADAVMVEPADAVRAALAGRPVDRSLLCGGHLSLLRGRGSGRARMRGLVCRRGGTRGRGRG